MSDSANEGAKELGRKLLLEVEEEDLSSIFKSLRELPLSPRSNAQHSQPQHNIFLGIPELDRFLPTITPPVIELLSPAATHHPSGAGKTSLVYLIIAHAILPASFSSISLAGQNAAVILFDPLHHFSNSRLTQVMLNLILIHLHAANQTLSDETRVKMKDVVAQNLLHVHVIRPQSWPSLLATLSSLPRYLFDRTQHKSIHRRIHSIILEDLDAFTWAIRNSSADTPHVPSSSLTSESTRLISSLQNNSKLFSCAVILSSASASSSTFRPAIPTSWPQGVSVTRLVVRRVEVLKFAPAISIEEAEYERQQRWEVVQKGLFECWKVGIGVRNREGFLFKIGSNGVEIEKDEKEAGND